MGGGSRVRIVLSLFLLVWSVSLQSNSLTIINDSPFPLDAALYAADGSVLGQYSLAPRERVKWNDDYEVAPNPNLSQTPYTVTWICKTGGIYGVCNTVSPGASVFAQGAQGNLLCLPKKKKEAPPNTQVR